MADPYEQAFASFQSALVDLDGDGVPDVTTADIANRMPGSGQTRMDRQRKASQYAMRGRDVPVQYMPTAEDEAQGMQRSRDAAGAGTMAAMTVAPVGPLMRAAGAAVRTVGVPGAAVIGSALGTSSVADAEANAPQIDYKTIFVQPPQPPARVTPDQIGDDEVDNFIRAQGGVQRAQQQLGIAADGRAGPGTRASIKRALADQRTGVLQSEFEQAQATWSDRNTAAKLEYEKELATKPFLERNPWWKDVVAPASYGAAFALPAVASYLVTRGRMQGIGAAANDIDAAVRAFQRSPSTMTGATAGRAATTYDDAVASYTAAEAARRPTDLRGYAAELIPKPSEAAGAILPSAAAGLPIAFDRIYAPEGSQAKEDAKKELTLQAVGERLLGPGAMGYMLAKSGGAAGSTIAAARPMPAPSPGNYQAAQTAGTYQSTADIAAAMTPARQNSPGLLQVFDDMMRGSPTYRAQRSGEAAMTNAQNAADVSAVQLQQQLSDAVARGQISAQEARTLLARTRAEAKAGNIQAQTELTGATAYRDAQELRRLGADGQQQQLLRGAKTEVQRQQLLTEAARLQRLRDAGILPADALPPPLPQGRQVPPPPQGGSQGQGLPPASPATQGPPQIPQGSPPMPQQPPNLPPQQTSIEGLFVQMVQNKAAQANGRLTDADLMDIAQQMTGGQTKRVDIDALRNLAEQVLTRGGQP